MFDEAPASVVELCFEELVGAFGQHFTILQVLLDEHRCEPLGDLHGRARLARRKCHPECVPPDRVDLDVEPHLLDDILHGRDAPLFGI
jgi:hypothetical protein